MTHLPPSTSKTALVLAGGGLTGAVYEIGALRAIDDLLMDRTVNDFDIYVGTSAGALVGSMLANGITPTEMLQSLTGDHDLPPLSRNDLVHFNYADLWRLFFDLPRTAMGAWSHYLRHLNDMTPIDLIWSLTDALPSGLYDNLALEKYLHNVIRHYGYSNAFDDLRRELYVIATDLDNGRRVVFGPDENADVPISLAVAASTALPVVYKPVRIGNHDYVDGGVRANASLDLAIENGATLVVCINPMVPFDNSDRRSIPFFGPDGGHLADKGFTAIASQVSRIPSHAGLHYHIKQLRKTCPGVDIILIEPTATDYQMFFYNIMRYSARLIVARHGFETVSLRLAENHAQFKDIMARHNVPVSPRLVLEELNEIQQNDYDPRVLRRVLEARSPAHKRRRAKTPAGDLQTTLDELETALGKLTAAK